MLSLVSLILFHWIIRLDGLDPQIGYIFDSCKSNNLLEFTPSSGGSLFWSKAGSGLMNNTHIIDCRIILKGLAQGSQIRKRFLGIHFRQWNYDSTYGDRYNQTLATILFSPFAQQIFNVCGVNCGSGCMQIEHPKTKVLKTLCNANQLKGTDYVEYFEEQTLTLRFYLLGGFYIPIANGTEAIFNRSSTDIIIDFFSFYFGKCQDENKEFQCVNTQRCIDIDLKCDNYTGRHCGLPLSGSGDTYDVTICDSATTTPVNLLPLLALLALPLLIMILIWLFYRPGLCCWRCARIRNWPGCAKCCSKLCAYPCVVGAGPGICGCCMSSGAGGPCGSCCGNSGTGGDADGLNPNKSSRNNDYSVQGHNNDAGWQDFCQGDGYHLRECR